MHAVPPCVTEWRIARANPQNSHDRPTVQAMTDDADRRGGDDDSNNGNVVDHLSPTPTSHHRIAVDMSGCWDNPRFLSSPCSYRRGQR